jgi:hypothetical protein
MDNSPHNQDDALVGFDKWLKESKIQPPSDMLPRVRSRLGEHPADFDDLLDELFLPDTRMRDPDMIRKIRLRIRDAEGESAGTVTWFKWLAPLAAAATLTLAFISFQSGSPDGPSPDIGPSGLTIVETSPSQLDSDVTQIFALAVNLQGDADMTKLESVENLAFLFD